MQNSYVIILAIGMVLVIITGEIDLSVGSVAAFVGAIAGTLMITWELPVIPSIIISLLVGAVIGAWQGFWVAYVKVPAFIVTLAGMLLFRGLTMVVLNGRTLAPFPSNFRIMSSEFMPDLLNGGSYNMMAIIIGVFAIIVYVYSEFRARKIKAAFNQTELSYPLFLTKVILISVLIGLFTERLAVYAGIPYILMILVALIASYTFFMSKTIPGRHVYAVGGNEKAARLSGVKSQKIKFWIYVNMGVLAALAGLVFSGV